MGSSVRLGKVKTFMGIGTCHKAVESPLAAQYVGQQLAIGAGRDPVDGIVAAHNLHAGRKELSVP